MKFCRINLSQTNYDLCSESRLWTPEIEFDHLRQIYYKYCEHKRFVSVMPLFESQFRDPANDVHVYYHNNQVVAWSLCHRYDEHNAESLQFAWNYYSPNLELGLRSLEHECAYYKQRGYRYLYLGESANYKAAFEGYEILGPI